MGCCGKLFLTLFVVLTCMIPFFLYIDQPQHWVYDPVRLQEIAKEGTAKAKAIHGEGATGRQIVDEVIKVMVEAYPETTRYTGNWLWNNAGGAMGSMTVLHCSFSEYIIMFGSATGTEGNSGRFLADDYFTIVYGEQWAAVPGGDKEVYKPGDQHWMHRGVAKQYRMPDECWALEYARGNIPSMMLFGFMDLLTSTVDPITFAQTIYESAGNMLMNTLRGKI
ncbi:C-8 sterol isomerase [Angomonas deanei]|uniref:ERG2 and Sigma1 receptor like protein, putative n=1 Tax=Angomonas deanei TaxID=59799 RepID=A0A7G2CK61_9TRYP|nr:C-8 sterol isomerase [Angomonas deanei]CAD2218602.1 ERG2 and Sigma1 receptor like protein, putative [Angomonas deanei]|eukprot:EPY41192.1 C-8 sterol isomerase [Angomonas deanei]